MRIKETGFAAVNILTKPPHIMVWTASGTARHVRKQVAENWHLPMGKTDGWKEAVKAGVRVRRVKIETI